MKKKMFFNVRPYRLHMGPVHGGTAAVTVTTTTHFYWLYVHIFYNIIYYTYMFFFLLYSLLEHRILCFHPTSLSTGYTSSSRIYTGPRVCSVLRRDLKNVFRREIINNKIRINTQRFVRYSVSSLVVMNI